MKSSISPPPPPSMPMQSCVDGSLIILVRKISKKIAMSQNFKAGDAVIVGDPFQIHHAIMNPGVDAAHATPDDGILAVSISNIRLEKESFLNCGVSIHSGE